MFLMIEEQDLKNIGLTAGAYESNDIKKFNGFEEDVELKTDEKKQWKQNQQHIL